MKPIRKNEACFEVTVSVVVFEQAIRPSGSLSSG
jgi:hypothetical protein